MSGYEEVATAFRDWEHFSSARTNPKYCAITLGDSLLPLLTPEEIDPPDWYPLRRILAELLSPQASERLRPRVARWVAHYIDEVIESGRCDFVYDLACPVPAAVTLEWLGFPPSDWHAHLRRVPRHRRVHEGQPRVRASERGASRRCSRGSARRSRTAGASHATTR